MISGVSSFSLDCMLPYNGPVPRSVLRVLLTLCVPAMVVMLYVAFWMIHTKKRNKPIEFFQKRSLLSFFAVSYLAYVSVTKIALNVVSCIRIYDSSQIDSAGSSLYWPMDTTIQCYKGSHSFLASLLGWPVVLLFSIGFPFSLSFFLTKNPSARLEHHWVHETAGFLYRAYSENFVYWESIVMLRKAILAVIIVFGYQLGSNIQGIVAVCLLSLALNLHHVYRPFRKEFSDLNIYEGTSLLVCLLAFASGLSFLDPRTTDYAKVVLTVALFIAICGLFCFLLSKLFFASVTYAKFSLIADGIQVPQCDRAFGVMKAFLRRRIGQQFDGIAKYLSIKDAGD